MTNTEKIGKLSLILGAILSVLLVIVGLISMKTDLCSSIFSSDKGHYALFMFIPFGAMLVSHLTAWLICLKTKKNDELQQEKSNNMGVFFKTYLYLWTIVTILIVVSGFLLFDFPVRSLSAVFCGNALILGVAWLSTVVVCIMVWAAFNAWKTNEVVGVVVAVIAFLLLLGATFLVGVLYDNNLRAHQIYENYTYGEEYSYTATPEYEYEGDYYEHYEGVEDESDMERAFRFMKYRLELENEQRAIDLIRNWGWWNSGRDNYTSGYGDFGGESHFQNCKSEFYALKANNMRNNDGLMSIANHYSNIANNRGYPLSPSDFERSGAKDCWKILLLAYDDIYSKKNSKKVLREIYKIMTKHDGYYNFSELRPYMSDDVIDEINNINNRTGTIHDVEWATEALSGWAYSFWARRHHDNVDKTAHTILKIIDFLYN